MISEPPDFRHLTNDELWHLQSRFRQLLGGVVLRANKAEEELNSAACTKESGENLRVARQRFRSEYNLYRFLFQLVDTEIVERRNQPPPTGDWHELRAVEPPDISVLEMLADMGVGVTGATIFELMKARVGRIGDKRAAASAETYTENELAERTQRTLAARLSVPFDDLQLLSIETDPQGEAVGRFKTSNGHFYVLKVEIKSGTTRVRRMIHEFPPEPDSD